jgi:GNAT superfamily N-acetyltransferase
VGENETPLETGYGANTPPGDNLTNDFQQGTARSYADLARARGARVERVAGMVTMTDTDVALPFWNRAVVEQPIGERTEELVATLKRFYGGARPDPFLLDSAWPTPDLRPYGFELMGHPPLMVRPAGVPLPPAPSELRIARVDGRDAAVVRDFERTLIDGFPIDGLQPFEKVRLYAPETFEAPGWHHFVAYLDDRPVAAGSSHVDERVLRVENIATLPQARGRGAGRAITAATIAADESKPATLVASDPGRPVYERLGFVAVLRVTYWLGPR